MSCEKTKNHVEKTVRYNFPKIINYIGPNANSLGLESYK